MAESMTFTISISQHAQRLLEKYLPAEMLRNDIIELIRAYPYQGDEFGEDARILHLPSKNHVGVIYTIDEARKHVEVVHLVTTDGVTWKTFLKVAIAGSQVERVVKLLRALIRKIGDEGDE